VAAGVILRSLECICNKSRSKQNVAKD